MNDTDTLTAAEYQALAAAGRIEWKHGRAFLKPALTSPEPEASPSPAIEPERLHDRPRWRDVVLLAVFAAAVVAFIVAMAV